MHGCLRYLKSAVLQELNKQRRVKVPPEAYKDGPDGLKLYDVKLGDGAVADVRHAAAPQIPVC